MSVFIRIFYYVVELLSFCLSISFKDIIDFMDGGSYIKVLLNCLFFFLDLIFGRYWIGLGV